MSHEKSSLSFLLIFLLLPYCISIDTIIPNQPLKDGVILISNGEHFALGFFSPNNSSRRYVGIWYNKISEPTVVWVANRDNPVNDTSGVMSVDRNGNLVIFNNQTQEVPVWSTNISTTGVHSNYSAQLLESGNLVVFQGDGNKVVAWQSFDIPTDTFIANMKLGVDRRSGLNRYLTSWKSRDDPGSGAYSYKIDINGSVPQLFLYKDSDRYWRGGPWDGLGWSGVPEMSQSYIFNDSYFDNHNEVAMVYGILNASVISRTVLNESVGTIERLNWHEGVQKWVGFWKVPNDPCDNYAHCGAFGNCNTYNASEFECKCLPGFEPKSYRNWYLRDGVNGCVRKRAGKVCRNGEGFVKVARVKVPDTSTAHVDMSLDIKACQEFCLRNCSCTGYTSADVSKGGNGCITWYGELIDVREFSTGGQDVFIRVDAIELATYSKRYKRVHSHIKVVVVVVSVAALLFILTIVFWLATKKKRGEAERSHHNLPFSPNNSSSKGEHIKERGTSANVHLYSLSTIIAATDNFSSANKVGKGGFGSVYKGILHNGQEIAVKRLSKTSGQGIEEFRNEVTLIAKLQHKNLVRLLGYCTQKEEKMLIYEYLPNKGLDCFIFGDGTKSGIADLISSYGIRHVVQNKEKNSMMGWRKHFDIILGIARGMVYLHHDSRLRIIHRDLKASNVLLDASLNPKISDFGMARILGGDQMEETTKRVVGTYGYMSPEYAMEGIFSIKSDVFSFGILLLEIISGRKNNSYHQESSINLIGHVWDLWRAGKALQMIDTSLSESYDRHDDEILRCIHIGLLCVQESPNVRPTMSKVAFMLSNEKTLPPPSQPAFLFRKPNDHPAKLSSNSPGTVSVNEVTLSMIEAR